MQARDLLEIHSDIKMAHEFFPSEMGHFPFEIA